jgi:hypothetical protein
MAMRLVGPFKLENETQVEEFLRAGFKEPKNGSMVEVRNVDGPEQPQANMDRYRDRDWRGCCWDSSVALSTALVAPSWLG